MKININLSDKTILYIAIALGLSFGGKFAKDVAVEFVKGANEEDNKGFFIMPPMMPSMPSMPTMPQKTPFNTTDMLK